MQGQPLRVLAYHLNEYGRPCQPTFETVLDNITELQALVGGSIQAVQLTSEILLVCNDEGKIIGLPPNRIWIDPKINDVLDLIVGDFFLCRRERDEFADIEDSDLEIADTLLPAVSSVECGGIKILPKSAVPLYKPSKEVLEQLYPKGSVLKLVRSIIDAMHSDNTNKRLVEVEDIDDANQIHVKWLGKKSNVALIYGLDSFIRIK